MGRFKEWNQPVRPERSDVPTDLARVTAPVDRSRYVRGAEVFLRSKSGLRLFVIEEVNWSSIYALRCVEDSEERRTGLFTVWEVDLVPSTPEEIEAFLDG